MSKTHEIKLLRRFADDVLKGKKIFEIRKNDRDYQVGDYIKFNVVDFGKDVMAYLQHPLNDKRFRINYLIDDPEWGLQDGYVVFGIVPDLDDDKKDVSPEGRAFRLLLDEYYQTPKNWEDYQVLKKGIDELENIRLNTTCNANNEIKEICGIPLKKAFNILTEYRLSNGKSLYDSQAIDPSVLERIYKLETEKANYFNKSCRLEIELSILQNKEKQYISAYEDLDKHYKILNKALDRACELLTLLLPTNNIKVIKEHLLKESENTNENIKN